MCVHPVYCIVLYHWDWQIYDMLKPPIPPLTKPQPSEMMFFICCSLTGCPFDSLQRKHLITPRSNIKNHRTAVSLCPEPISCCFLTGHGAKNILELVT
jgi:hypothetical protein